MIAADYTIALARAARLVHLVFRKYPTIGIIFLDTRYCWHADPGGIQ